MIRVPDERLQSHLSVGEGWSAMRSLTAVEVQQVVEELVAIRAGKLWRCFHCGDVFTDEAEAREHFGDTMDDEPICQVTAERYRAVEREMESYRNESDATAKTFYDIGHRAAVAERDAEQKGYDRGIADAKQFGADLGLATRANIAIAIASVPYHPVGERVRLDIIKAIDGLFESSPAVTPDPLQSILKLAIERVCPDCRGECYVPNPHARWDRAEDGAEYCDGPEEIDCETCHGLGFVMPRKPEPPRLSPASLEDDMPF